MNSRPSRSRDVFKYFAFAFLAAFTAHAAVEFTPGAIYKDFVQNMYYRNEWRVTNPNATAAGPNEFLPNPTMTVMATDFTDVESAEAVFDYWGGHPNTINRQFRFNGNAWITIPYAKTIPASNAHIHMFEETATVPVPVANLQSGPNVYEGTCSYTNPKGWGQWGWYTMRLRLKYAASKTHAPGQIVSPVAGGSFADGPIIRVIPTNPADVAKIEVIAYYKGYPVDGDSSLTWHRTYVNGRTLANEIQHHVGTITAAPYMIQWDTKNVPDQDPGAVKLIARIQHTNGAWFVTNIVDNLTLVRSDYSVKLFMSHDVPEKFWVPWGNKVCNVNIADLTGFTKAWMMIRTWNAVNNEQGSTPTKINTYNMNTTGANHNFDQRALSVPVNKLIAGSNKITFSSTTTHHGCEILWPGPAFRLHKGTYDPKPDTVPVVMISPDGGTHTDSVEVTLTAVPGNAKVFYKTMPAGSAAPVVPPNRDDTEYQGPIVLRESVDLYAIAYKSDYSDSSTVASASFVVDVTVPAPVITPADTAFDDSITVTMSVTAPACSVYYTLDGTVPTKTSNWYEAPFVLKHSAAIKAVAYTCNGVNSSGLVSAACTLKVPEPAIAPAGSTFKDSVSVSLSVSAPACSIYYTTNGSDPTRTSTWYDGPFMVRQSLVVKARAFTCSHLDSSAIASGVFTAGEDVPAPNMTPAGGNFADSVIVRLGTALPGCSLYFTIDGSEPTRASAKYAGPFALKATAEVKARAYNCALSDSSAITSFTFDVSVAIWEKPRQPKIRNFSVKTVGKSFHVSLPEKGTYRFRLFAANGRLEGFTMLVGPGIFHMGAEEAVPGVYLYDAVSPSGKTWNGRCILMR